MIIPIWPHQKTCNPCAQTRRKTCIKGKLLAGRSGRWLPYSVPTVPCRVLSCHPVSFAVPVCTRNTRPLTPTGLSQTRVCSIQIRLRADASQLRNGNKRTSFRRAHVSFKRALDINEFWQIMNIYYRSNLYRFSNVLSNCHEYKHENRIDFIKGYYVPNIPKLKIP